MKIALLVVFAFILDFIFKDPKNIPSLSKIIGKCIDILDISRKIYKHKYISMVLGFIVTVFISVLFFIIPYYILSFLYSQNTYIAMAIEIVMCTFLISHGALKETAMKVYHCLSSNSLDDAKKTLSTMVGRDTSNMTEEQIIKTTAEATAEDTNDLILAPIFYMLIGGASLGFLYKAVNILDSKIGYRNQQYLYFGKFAARLDDILNIIPARITGITYVFAAFLAGLDYKNACAVFLKDRWNSFSPNSGYPISAVSGALDLQLGGGAYYSGEYIERAYIGEDRKTANIEDIPKACMLMTITSVIGFIMLILLKLAITGISANISG